MKKAVFGAGCFWGIEAAFRKIKGVESTRVGYCGGTLSDPTYEDVCRGDTGHAECVELAFNPEIVSYEELLSVFWACHDPTTLNRQGPDIGSQYRSVIFFQDEDQRRAAESSKQNQDKSGKWPRPVVTQIVESAPFYEAEEYHQQYLEKRGGGLSCH